MFSQNIFVFVVVDFVFLGGLVFSFFSPSTLSIIFIIFYFVSVEYSDVTAEYISEQIKTKPITILDV